MHQLSLVLNLPMDDGFAAIPGDGYPSPSGTFGVFATQRRQEAITAAKETAAVTTIDAAVCYCP